MYDVAINILSCNTMHYEMEVEHEKAPLLTPFKLLQPI